MADISDGSGRAFSRTEADIEVLLRGEEVGVLKGDGAGVERLGAGESGCSFPARRFRRAFPRREGELCSCSCWFSISSARMPDENVSETRT